MLTKEQSEAIAWATVDLQTKVYRIAEKLRIMHGISVKGVDIQFYPITEYGVVEPIALPGPITIKTFNENDDNP